MYSFRRLALLLALTSPAFSLLQAQSSTSSSTPAASDAQTTAAPAQPAQSPSQLSVQARIRARREQRRTAAIHDAYSHLYEAYVGGGYLRFTPGSTLQRVNEYDWNVGLTRYYSPRFGVAIDGRGYYGTPFIAPNQGDPPAGSVALTKPAISQYEAMIGPSYRFYVQPRYSISARVLGGFADGNFTGDTSGYGTLGVLWSDGPTYAVNAAVQGDWNLAPNMALRVAPEYLLTGFGSSRQNNLGFTAGIIYRFGKQ